jgi:hypothetical protein
MSWSNYRRRVKEGAPPGDQEVVLEGGLTEDHVLDAVRVAATVNAAAVALELPAAYSTVDA